MSAAAATGSVPARSYTLGQIFLHWSMAARVIWQLVFGESMRALEHPTGAGDAFNGGFAAALARGASPVEAVRFGCAVAGISVTRAGTAPSMPYLAEVEALLAATR